MARHTNSLLLYSFPLIVSLTKSSSAFPVQASKLNCFPPANSTAASINWGACPVEADVPEALQCAAFSVPIDWEKPYGEHFDLGLVRLPATPSNSSVPKVGTLFINPGGPGGRASELVAQLASGALQADALFAAFDIIGLDPRGVGLSNQAQCDMSIYAERVSLFPTTQKEYDALVDKNKRLGESCRQLTGPLLEHLDTISAAKDHEAVRVALGDIPMNFAGMSYGSQLGAQYAALFPNNIRTLVLDGVLQHSQSEAANLLTETSSYSIVLTHFFEWAKSNESSVLQGQDVEAIWTSLITNASSTPIPASSCNGTDCRTDVNAEEILFNAQHLLNFAGPETGLGASWGTLSSALYNATQGDASTFSTPLIDPTSISGLSIGCLDWTHQVSLTFSGLLSQKDMAQAYSPLTRGASQMWNLQHSCIGWPVPVKNPPKKLDIKTETTVLLTNADADPSTGYPWALGMLEEIDNVVLVTRKGDGHTSLPLGVETTQIIGEYLITGQAPEQGLITSS